MKLLTDLINSGTLEMYSKQPYIEILLVRLVNTINILFIATALIAVVFIIALTDFGLLSYIRFIILIIFNCFSIILNYYQRILVAKINTIFAPFFLIFVFPIFSQQLYEGMFLWFPYGILIIGSSSFFMFSYEKEKPLLNFVLTFFALAVLFFDLILLKFTSLDMDLSFIYTDNYIFYTLPKVILLLFFYTSLYFAKITTHKYRLHVNRLNKKLNDLNLNLEYKIRERTVQLDQQNTRIKDLTFVNSHRVRACVARIIGLINLIFQESKEEEKRSYYDKIRNTALELDKETKVVSEKLSEEY